MVKELGSCAVDRAVRHYIWTCCFSVKHVALRRKRKQWSRTHPPTQISQIIVFNAEMQGVSQLFNN
jgi:hypothetical protein